MVFPNVAARLTNNGTRKLPGYTEPHERICKRTDTDVAFTSEYSTGYRIHGNVSTISKLQTHPRTQHQ